jgi:ubiquitin-hydrolase Zn-finger-containing protein
MTQILRQRTVGLYHCVHLKDIQLTPGLVLRVKKDDWEKPYGDRSVGCIDCLKELNPLWVHLRQCLICGYVGCCNSSPKKHATAHFVSSHHPIIKSIEPEEDWGWCYVDETELILPAYLTRPQSGYEELADKLTGAVMEKLSRKASGGA